MELSNEVDFTEFVGEITSDLYRELELRLAAPLGDNDRAAVITAIGKGAWRGILRGIALTTHAVNERADEIEAEDPDADVFRIDSQMQTDPEPDLWAERYGS